MLNIKVSHDVEGYKEPVFGPFDARQSIFVLLAVVLGAVTAACAYFLLHMPLTLCGYAVVPAVAPVILIGFGGKNNMSFLEQQKKMKNRLREPLYYRSTENASCYKETSRLPAADLTGRQQDASSEVEQTKRKAKRILTAMAVFVILTVLFAAVASVRSAGT